MGLYQHTFYSEELGRIMTEEAFIEQMLKVEAGLAKAQATAGIIPDSSVETIQTCAKIAFIDLDRLKKDIILGGNAAIPLVKQLTTLVKTKDFEASKHVHFGATSQDIIDTATVLQMVQAAKWMSNQLNILESALENLAKTHRDTLMIGRTLLQQAKPITFGFKAALWLKSIRQDRSRLQQAMENNRVLQMFGAVGSGHARMNTEVLEKLAIALQLKTEGSWQSSRGNLCEFASTLGILSGNLGKIAKDISLLMQTEIAEVFEGAAEGKGGSSTMPHKRNPVNCALILSNATRTPALVSTMLSAMLQEHERSAGLWHAEWETLHDLIQLTGGSLEKSVDLLAHLEVNQDKVRENLEVTQGLIFAEGVSLALAPEMGKLKAHEFVQKACKTALAEQKHLKQVLEEQGVTLPNLAELFKPENALGLVHEMIDEILKK
ncbi:3-carboxy-cis,cis-muconate cycloisomerase [Jiulongibacter sediminis]|uniref:3-carboxy-cis,cis-muconate cycloisomerase n=1 Tax=Jiulongibacter sediminis TaxID=1605367 RepID=UPI0026E981B9|nr:3-carboxy-cis,cis-muconate cycloisomerase [Jiulongibacter sediminis]